MLNAIPKVSSKTYSGLFVESNDASGNPAERSSRGEPAFVARGISKIYLMGEVQVHALTSVDLEFYHGELVVLLGASGSGKSTLLNILGGLDVPTSGGSFTAEVHRNQRKGAQSGLTCANRKQFLSCN
jgi:ABC-type glutathione transport system ATPase component